ncbi:MAG TPA: hypothetical protein PK135_08175, partial [Arenimonas sp.]|nr:hypothetical protein [Arenimonas sp.]
KSCRTTNKPRAIFLIAFSWRFSVLEKNCVNFYRGGPDIHVNALREKCRTCVDQSACTNVARVAIYQTGSLKRNPCCVAGVRFSLTNFLRKNHSRTVKAFPNSNYLLVHFL